jgi:hypothetical protein
MSGSVPPKDDCSPLPWRTFRTHKNEETTNRLNTHLICILHKIEYSCLLFNFFYYFSKTLEKCPFALLLPYFKANFLLCNINNGFATNTKTPAMLGSFLFVKLIEKKAKLSDNWAFSPIPSLNFSPNTTLSFGDRIIITITIFIEGGEQKKMLLSGDDCFRI